jgi:hypothetical protein
LAAVALVASSQAVLADMLTPFRAPNLSPPIAIIGLPLWAEVPAATTTGFTTEVANHYRLKSLAGEQIVLDGETVRVRAFLERPIGERWSLGVDVPYLYQSGGMLDDLIDGWHSLFGLPDGARNYRPEGLIEFDLANESGSFYSLTEAGSGLGDIQISGARRVGSGHGWNLRGTVKLPTGRESVLAGSGSTDWMFSALRIVRGNFKGRTASFFLGGAIIDIEQPTQLLVPANDLAVAAVIGGALRLGERMGIKGQIDANSALYDSALVELGHVAVQATLGGWLEFAGTGVFEFAIGEDAFVATTPDVVVHFNLSWRLP